MVRGRSYGRQWASILGAILGQVAEGWQADRLAITGDGGNVGTISISGQAILIRFRITAALIRFRITELQLLSTPGLFHFVTVPRFWPVPCEDGAEQ